MATTSRFYIALFLEFLSIIWLKISVSMALILHRKRTFNSLFLLRGR